MKRQLKLLEMRATLSELRYISQDAKSNGIGPLKDFTISSLFIRVIAGESPDPERDTLRYVLIRKKRT